MSFTINPAINHSGQIQNNPIHYPQPVITSSELTTETLEQGVKFNNMFKVNNNNNFEHISRVF